MGLASCNNADATSLEQIRLRLDAKGLSQGRVHECGDWMEKAGKGNGRQVLRSQGGMMQKFLPHGTEKKGDKLTTALTGTRE